MAPTEPEYITIGAGDPGPTVSTMASPPRGLIVVICDEAFDDIVLVGRAFGKTDAFSEYIIQSALCQSREIILDPPFRHDYPMLIRWHRGPIVRQLRPKDRPPVVRRHNNTNDRRVNKRKTFLRSLL